MGFEKDDHIYYNKFISSPPEILQVETFVTQNGSEKRFHMRIPVQLNDFTIFLKDNNVEYKSIGVYSKKCPCMGKDEIYLTGYDKEIRTSRFDEPDYFYRISEILEHAVSEFLKFRESNKKEVDKLGMMKIFSRIKHSYFEVGSCKIYYDWVDNLKLLGFKPYQRFCIVPNNSNPHLQIAMAYDKTDGILFTLSEKNSNHWGYYKVDETKNVFDKGFISEGLVVPVKEIDGKFYLESKYILEK